MWTGYERKLAISTEEDNQRNLENVDSRLGVSSGEGPTDGDESNKILNSDSSRRNPAREESPVEGQGNVGKIARQLRELQQAHLAFIEKQQQTLEAQLTASTEYRDKVVDSIQSLEKQILELLEENLE